MQLMWNQYDFGKGFTAVRDRLILELFYNTGMRRAELVTLTDQSLDLYNSSVKLLGKGNKERIVPINSKLRDFIKEYIKARNETFNSKSFPSLIVTKKGEKMYPRMVHEIVTRVLSAITTVEKKSPHVLRHTFATHMLDNGAEISAIKELLGHASLATTQVYTHNTIEKLKDVYKKAHPKA